MFGNFFVWVNADNKFCAQLLGLPEGICVPKMNHVEAPVHPNSNLFLLRHLRVRFVKILQINLFLFFGITAVLISSFRQLRFLAKSSKSEFILLTSV